MKMYWEKLAVSRPVNKTAATVAGGTSQARAPVAIVPESRQHWQTPPRTIQIEPNEADLTGRRFGRMVVVGKFSRGEGKLKPTWLVRCACGDYETRKSRAINNPINTDDKCVQCEFNRVLAKRGSSLTRKYA